MKHIVDSGTSDTTNVSFHTEFVSFLHLKTLDPKPRKLIHFPPSTYKLKPLKVLTNTSSAIVLRFPVGQFLKWRTSTGKRTEQALWKMALP